MTGDKFDKELAALYQQRKAKIVEPYIDLQIENRKVSYSPLKLLSIFLVAGFASFGIMAIISHFATPPTPSLNPEVTLHITELRETIPAKADKEDVLPAKPLPPKPDVTHPVTLTVASPDSDNVKAQFNINMAGKVTVEMIALPQLTKPTSTIEPTLKVLPRYSNSDAQEGEVELSYRVDDLGNVINIKVLDSNVNKGLQRSAKKALSKWQYNPNISTVNEFKVRFKFSPTEG